MIGLYNCNESNCDLVIWFKFDTLWNGLLINFNALLMTNELILFTMNLCEKNMLNNPIKFRSSQKSDISNLVELINSAYRLQQGQSWTSEADIVSGARINAQQLRNDLAQDSFQLFVAELENEVVACIGLTFHDSEVEIGTFCIAPHFQNQGLGKMVLEYAEQVAVTHDKNITTLVMWVLSVRSELIAYYERRGYVQTGVMDDYPLDANVGKPIVDLHLVEMRKVDFN